MALLLFPVLSFSLRLTVEFVPFALTPAAAAAMVVVPLLLMGVNVVVVVVVVMVELEPLGALVVVLLLPSARGA